MSEQTPWQTNGKRFPVRLSVADLATCPEAPQTVPWELIEPQKERIRARHGVTADEVAANGGLSPAEIILLLTGLITTSSAPTLLKTLVRQFEGTTPTPPPVAP